MIIVELNQSMGFTLYIILYLYKYYLWVSGNNKILRTQRM